MVFLNVYDSEKPIYAFMANYMGNKIPVRIPSNSGSEWVGITVRCLANDCYSVQFDVFNSLLREEKLSPLPFPRIDDVNFWIDVNLMRLDAETCDGND